MREAIEAIVEVTRWDKGFADCVCPLGHPDARVYVDRAVPFMHCLHEKCRDDVAALNAELREATAWLPDVPAPPKLTPQERAALERKRQLRRLELRTREYLLPKLRREPVPVEAWSASSPCPVKDVPIEQHWTLFLRTLYDPSDYIWIGHLFQSGHGYRDCYHCAGDWLDLGLDCAPGPFVSLAAFDRGKLARHNNWSRSAKNLERRLYVVLESDTESRETFGAVVRYAQKYKRLRAVIDTGGKSLHAVFEPFRDRRVTFPPRPQDYFYKKHSLGKPDNYYVERVENPNYTQELAAWEAAYGKAWRAYMRQWDTISARQQELNAILIGLGCDGHMLTSGLTTRLPGHPRLDEEGNDTGRWQRLLYLDPVYEPKS